MPSKFQSRTTQNFWFGLQFSPNFSFRTNLLSSLSPPIQRLTQPHVDSFDYMFEGGLEEAIKDLDVKDIADQAGHRLYCKPPHFHFSSLPPLLFSPIPTPSTDWVEEVYVGSPMLSDAETYSKERQIYPSEVWGPCVFHAVTLQSHPPVFFFGQCRERGSSYRGRMQIKLCFRVDNGETQVETKSVGLLPIMTRVILASSPLLIVIGELMLGSY